MGLETGSTIASFITSNPTSSDPVNQGDDHIRLLKSVLQAQFPGAGGLGFNTPITTTEAELNALHGLVNYNFASGTRIPFAQASAPTGWTQDVTDNATNRMLRVVNTTGNGVGGSASPILNNTVPSHTHVFTGSVLAAHTHTDTGHQHTGHNTPFYNSGIPGGGNNTTSTPGDTGVAYAQISSNSAGTPAGTNAANAGASDWTPRYIDMIICAKN